MTTSTETYSLPCTVKHETDRALLIVDHASGEEIWIPLSQVAEIHTDGSGQGTVVMSSWIAKKKGLL